MADTPTGAARTTFLISPASCAGRRAQQLLRRGAGSELAGRLRGPEGVPLGELFAFLSSLYFRGKLAYAERFARPPDGSPGVLVIVPGRGLLRPDERLDARGLRAMARVRVDVGSAGYVRPLRRDARALADRRPAVGSIVLLGSVATPKYTEPLMAALGDRLLAPRAFFGLGSMRRGSLLLRCVEEGRELEYVEVGAGRR